jgi:hypothetical protein
VWVCVGLGGLRGLRGKRCEGGCWGIGAEGLMGANATTPSIQFAKPQCKIQTHTPTQMQSQPQPPTPMQTQTHTHTHTSIYISTQTHTPHLATGCGLEAEVHADDDVAEEPAPTSIPKVEGDDTANTGTGGRGGSWECFLMWVVVGTLCG